MKHILSFSLTFSLCGAVFAAEFSDGLSDSEYESLLADIQEMDYGAKLGSSSFDANQLNFLNSTCAVVLAREAKYEDISNRSDASRIPPRALAICEFIQENHGIKPLGQ